MSILLLAPLVFVFSASAHESIDPIVTLTFENVEMDVVRLSIIEQTGFILQGDASGERGRVSISVKNAPLADVFRELRTSYQICAYRLTAHGIPPTISISFSPCERRDRMCASGLAEPFPQPQLQHRPDGTTEVPKTGPFLCGGPEYKQMLEEGSDITIQAGLKE